MPTEPRTYTITALHLWLVLPWAVAGFAGFVHDFVHPAYDRCRVVWRRWWG